MNMMIMNMMMMIMMMMVAIVSGDVNIPVVNVIMMMLNVCTYLHA